MCLCVRARAFYPGPWRQVLLGHSGWVRWLCFSGDSTRLISGGDDSVIIMWAMPEGQVTTGQTVPVKSLWVKSALLETFT